MVFRRLKLNWLSVLNILSEKQKSMTEKVWDLYIHMEIRKPGFAKLIFKKEITKGIKHLLACERIYVTWRADQKWC